MGAVSRKGQTKARPKPSGKTPSSVALDLPSESYDELIGLIVSGSPAATAYSTHTVLN